MVVMNDDRDRPSFVHHVELWMDDLAAAERQWGPVLLALGCAPFQHWENGRSARAIKRRPRRRGR